MLPIIMHVFRIFPCGLLLWIQTYHLNPQLLIPSAKSCGLLINICPHLWYTFSYQSKRSECNERNSWEARSRCYHCARYEEQAAETLWVQLGPNLEVLWGNWCLPHVYPLSTVQVSPALNNACTIWLNAGAFRLNGLHSSHDFSHSSCTNYPLSSSSASLRTQELICPNCPCIVKITHLANILSMLCVKMKPSSSLGTLPGRYTSMTFVLIECNFLVDHGTLVMYLFEAAYISMWTEW